MFVQVIEATVADAEALRAQFDRWRDEHAEAAAGWLGTTAGVTADGTALVAARFASADAARDNSQRPEQSAWWSDTERCLSGPVSFDDFDDVGLFRSGGSDDAGFVQVIRGRVNDVEAARALFLEGMDDDVRPDVIGGFVGLSPDGAYTTVVYFTSEAEARAGESGEDDEEFQRRMDALHDEPPRFLDLDDPWLWSP